MWIDFTVNEILYLLVDGHDNPKKKNNPHNKCKVSDTQNKIQYKNGKYLFTIKLQWTNW